MSFLWAITAETIGPCLNLPPVLLELTNSEHPFHRFTPFQLLNTVPTLLIDSVSEPLPAQQLAAILIGGMMDPSVDVRVEAIKAMRSIVMEGLTGREREQIGPPMINMTIKVSQAGNIVLMEDSTRSTSRTTASCPRATGRSRINTSKSIHVLAR